MTKSFSLEVAVVGRNDEYEPNWVANLYASLAYNRALFADSPVDFRVAFVEWNPPRDRPLLSFGLVERFPFLRAIVIDAEVHQALCMSADLSVLLNFSLNSALRTSAADYCLIAGGDMFLGRTVVDHLRRTGLQPGCLYRAERVNIRNDLDFPRATPAEIEDAANIVSVDVCTEPPYDEPPFTNACGDFILVDRTHMAGLRGFDEGIRFARLHLDSRFCLTAMMAGLDCKLIGRLFHISHRNSLVNRPHDYPGRPYDLLADLPYINSRVWGLADHDWRAVGERLWRVSRPSRPGEGRGIPTTWSAAEVAAADAITKRLVARREETQPAHPETWTHVASLDLGAITTEPHWTGAVVTRNGQDAEISTVAEQWGYSAVMPIRPDLRGVDDEDWRWLAIDMEVLDGGVGVGFLSESRIVSELVLDCTQSRATHYQRLPRDADALLIRNVRHGGQASRAAIYGITCVKSERRRLPTDQILIAGVPA